MRVTTDKPAETDNELTREVQALARLLTYAEQVAADQNLWHTKELIGAALGSLTGTYPSIEGGDRKMDA